MQVTIETAGALLEEGGIVLVVGRPMPRADWRALFGTSDRDPVQPRATVTARSPATAVEIFYPDDGTYTFSLRPVEERELRTRELSVGSGSVLDVETGQDIEWPSQSTIQVEGRGHDARWVRTAADAFSQAFRDGGAASVRIQHFEGGRVLELTDEAIARFVEDAR